MIDLDISSMYPHQISPDLVKMKPFILIDSSSDSNGVMWYEIGVKVNSLQQWIESQPEDMWCEGTYTWGKQTTLPYLVHESLYTFITLRWE
jgi:hypothetical protein